MMCYLCYICLLETQDHLLARLFRIVHGAYSFGGVLGLFAMSSTSTRIRLRHAYERLFTA
jgi:hypothetical protein